MISSVDIVDIPTCPLLQCRATLWYEEWRGPQCAALNTSVQLGTVRLVTSHYRGLT